MFDQLKNRHDAQWMVELTEVANYFAFVSGWSTHWKSQPLPRETNCRAHMIEGLRKAGWQG